MSTPHYPRGTLDADTSAAYVSIMIQQCSPLLFQPASDYLPSYLAGREVEQRGSAELLQQLQTGRGAPADVVLTGLRDNGKTVLLR